MLKRFVVLASLGLAVLMLGTGCSNKTSAQRDSLVNQNKALADQLAAEKAAREAAEQRANSLANSAVTAAPTEAAPATPSMDENTTGSEPTLTPGPRSTHTSTVGEITRGHNKLGEDTLTVSSDVLFDLGKASLKPAAKKALDKAAAILHKEYAGRQIRIEGYTDPTPVRKAGWDDNWDLGAARARAVMLYLQGKGVKNMYIASFGPTNLKSTKNQALNRRVEIVVVKGSK
jgi:flagellar motor protein MotB